MHGVQDDLDKFAGHVRLITLPMTRERRGQLVEYDYALLPFVPQRTFVIGNVPSGTIRGGHAHKSCQQLLACLRGRITVGVVSKSHSADIALTDASCALYVNAGIWSQQRYDEDDSCLIVFTSLPFDPASYMPEPTL